MLFFTLHVSPVWVGDWKRRRREALVQWAHAPASVCVNAEEWQSYKGGTLTGTQCGGHSTDDTDHCVQVVGFSKGSSAANTNMYWIVRNSWGTEWGIGGYIHVEYGTNACGIANDATFVTL